MILKKNRPAKFGSVAFLELNVVSNVIFRNYSSKHNGFLAYFSRLDMELQERVGFMLLLLYKSLQFAIEYVSLCTCVAIVHAVRFTKG